MKVSIGSDHGGFELKGALIKALSGAYEMTDRVRRTARAAIIPIMRPRWRRTWRSASPISAFSFAGPAWA